jgi:AcrR family transcriptional regulator
MSKAKSASGPKKTVGRPKSASSHAAIIAAARAILDEIGPNRLTIDGVAKRAGVGKPTIYRTWANAQELAMAALVAPEDTAVALNQDSMEALLESIITRLNTKRGHQMALMLASAEPDGELFKAFANRVILKGRQDGLEILQRQMALGQIRADTNLAAVLDMIFGAIMLRLLLRHEALDIGLARESLAALLDGIAVH